MTAAGVDLRDRLPLPIRRRLNSVLIVYAYLADLIPRLQRFSSSLDNVALFADHPWVQVSASSRTVYVFRKGGELLISQEGNVMTARWEYLPALRSVVVEANGKKTLYNQGFLDDSVLALRQDGRGEYLILGNENKIGLVNEQSISRVLYTRYSRLAIDTHSSKSSSYSATVRQQDGQSGSDWVAWVIIGLILIGIVITYIMNVPSGY